MRRSTRIRVKTNPGYIPSMSGGSKYAYAVTQLEQVLHQNAHMFFRQEMYQEPDVVPKITTQLSLKVGLQTWGTEAKKAAHSEMKQVH